MDRNIGSPTFYTLGLNFTTFTAVFRLLLLMNRRNPHEASTNDENDSEQMIPQIYLWCDTCQHGIQIFLIHLPFQAMAGLDFGMACDHIVPLEMLLL